MAMRLEKENVLIILNNYLENIELWDVNSAAAEKQLAYIMGLRDMANAIIEAIGQLGGK